MPNSFTGIGGWNAKDTSAIHTDDRQIIIGSGNEISADPEGFNKLIGDNNYIEYVDNAFIVGNNNKIEYDDGYINNLNLFGDNNYIKYWSEDTCIFGSNNSAFDEFDNSCLLGSENNVTMGMSTFVTGWKNYIYYSYGTQIFGDRNSATNDKWADYITVFGPDNKFQGDTQLIAGSNNATDGEVVFTLGFNLSAKNCQHIIGFYNDYSYGSADFCQYTWNSSTSAAEIHTNSGILFGVGNGYFHGYYYSDGRKIDGNWYYYFDENNNPLDFHDPDNFTRSNAMIVSADGTVSSTKLATRGITDVEAAITALQTQLGNIETALNAIINGSNS